jgi:hypothetical protein
MSPHEMNADRYHDEMSTPSLPIQVVSARRTCNACPSQWSGKLADGREIYARFRWGHLTVTISPKVGEDAVFGTLVAEWSDDSGGWGGVMDDDQLRAVTAGRVEWPAEIGGRTLEDLE